MNSDPHPPESEDDVHRGKGRTSVLVDVFAEGVAERVKVRRSPIRPPANQKNGPAIPPAAQMALGAVFGFMPCLIGWLSLTDKVRSGNFGNPQLAVGLLSSGLLTVAVVLAVQVALSIFLIWRKLKFAAIGVWLVYLPFVLFFLA